MPLTEPSPSAESGEPRPADARPGGLRRDAEPNRQKLLRAARELFAARGLDVSLDDVARHAGVGVATAYRRFPDKEQLIDALFEERMAELVRAAEEARRQPDAWAALAGWLARLGEMQAADRGLRMLFGTTERGASRVAGPRQRLTPAIEDLVTRAQAAGAMRRDVALPDLAVITFMLGAVTDYAGGVQPQAWRRSLGLLLDGLATRRDAPSRLEPGPLDDEQLDRVMRGQS